MSSLVAIWCAVADDGADGSAWRRRQGERTVAEPSAALPAADGRLVERLQAGDEGAFRECYDAYYVPLWRYAVRLIGSRDAAHDVVQNVFFSVFTKRETLVVRDSMRTYLFGAVRHAALNLLRHDSIAHRVANAVIGVGDAPAMGIPASRPDDDAVQHDIEVRVMRALATLPERQRSAMILRWEHGLTTAQIARSLGVADTVAGRLLMKASLQLRRLLTNIEP